MKDSLFIQKTLTKYFLYPSHKENISEQNKQKFLPTHFMKFTF